MVIAYGSRQDIDDGAGTGVGPGGQHEPFADRRVSTDLTRILHQGPRMLAEFAAVLAPLWARRGAVIQ